MENTETQKRNMLNIDLYLGRYIFGCNIPFSTVESDHFKNFTRSLNPNYKPPSRKTLSTSILNKVYEDILKKDSFKQDEKCVLVLDGWKNKSANEKYVVGILDNANGDRIFLNSWDFTEIPETGLALSNVVKEAVQEAKLKYKADIFALVSDNASNMLLMGKLSKLWHCTCNSHSGNLLAKALVESSVTNKVTLILKEFMSPALERQLVLLGGKKVSLPCDTRWCSYRDSYRCFLANLSAMKLIISGVHNLKAKVVRLILDPNFEQEILNFIIIFDGVCTLINKCQKSDSTIADALEEWLSLEFPICNEEYENILQSRLKKVVKPISLAATVLHPVYKGKIFANNLNYLKMSNDFFKENLSETELKVLTAYQKEEGIFSKMKKIKNPKTYWSLIEPSHPELSALANLLFRIPSSSAAIERLFSQWSFVHNKLRNRLTAENSKKLIHIYYSLKLVDLNECEDW